MPIYEYYCPDNHRIYQFFAKTLAQGRTIPKCPDNPGYRMVKVLSAFAIGGGAREGTKDTTGETDSGGGEGGADDPKMEAAMAAMESEFSSADENDPRAMGRMMRRMAELTGEKIDGEMEEVVRKLEEGTDPEALEDQLGGPDGEDAGADDPYGAGGNESSPGADPKEPRQRVRFRRGAPVRDPKLYDYA